LIRALDQVKTPLVLYFQEDYFIHRPVRSDLILKAVEHMIARPEVKHIGLTKHGSHGPYLKTDEDWLHLIPRYLQMAKNGALTLDGIITKRIALDGINDAMDEIRAGKAGRIMIDL